MMKRVNMFILDRLIDLQMALDRLTLWLMGKTFKGEFLLGARIDAKQDLFESGGWGRCQCDDCQCPPKAKPKKRKR